MKTKMKYLWLALVALALTFGMSAMADTDPTVITTAVTGAFAGVATLCVSIGTFFIVYRIVKKIR